MTKIHFAKFHSDIPAVDELLNRHWGPTPFKISHVTTADGKSYKITKPESIQRTTGELIGCRILGGLLVALSFGLLYFYNQQVKQLFEDKYIHVTAILEETPVATSAKKTEKVASLLQKQEVLLNADEPTLDLSMADPKIEQKELVQPISYPQIDRFVKPQTTLTNALEEDQKSQYLALAGDSRKGIEFYLSIEELLRFSGVSRGIKRTVEESLITEIRQIELFVRLYLKIEIISPDKFNLFVENSPVKDLLNDLLGVLKTPSLLNEDFLKTLTQNQTEPFLKAFLELASDLSASQDVYKKFASHKTKFALVARLAETTEKARNLKLYENWADELRKGVNFENKKEKNAFYQLLFHLVIPTHLDEKSYMNSYLQVIPNSKSYMTSSIYKEIPDLPIYELNLLIDVLNTPNQLNEDFLEELDLNVKKPFLKAFFALAPDLTNQDLYKKYASHEEKIALVTRLAKDPQTAKDLQLYQNWADELRKGVNFENKKEKDAFYKLLFNIIIPRYLIGGFYVTTRWQAYSVIDKEMPALSLSELSKDTMSRMDFRLPDVAPSLAAYRALELCKSFDGEDLRNKFNNLYHQGIKAYREGIEVVQENGRSTNWQIEDSKDAFCNRLYGLLKAVDFPKDLVRKVVYAINGTAKSSELQLEFMRLCGWSGFGESKNQTAVMPALEEFARSHRDTAFKPVFQTPFRWIDRVDEVGALISGVKSFDESARSIYLRAIAYGIHSNREISSIKKLSSDQMMEAFATSQVEFPKGGIVYELEFIKYASSLSPFIKKINDIKNKEAFTKVLKDILSHPSSKLKKLRLQVLSNGTEFLDFSSAYQMTKHRFALDQLTPLTIKEWERLDQSFRDNLMRISSNTELNQLIEENEDNSLKLRALANHAYHLFNISKVSPKERREIFTARGLNMDQYGTFDLEKWLEAEEKYFFQEI